MLVACTDKYTGNGLEVQLVGCVLVIVRQVFSRTHRVSSFSVLHGMPARTRKVSVRPCVRPSVCLSVRQSVCQTRAS